MFRRSVWLLSCTWKNERKRSSCKIQAGMKLTSTLSILCLVFPDRLECVHTFFFAFFFFKKRVIVVVMFIKLEWGKKSLQNKYLLPTYNLKIVIGCFTFFLVDAHKGHIFYCDSLEVFILFWILWSLTDTLSRDVDNIAYLLLYLVTSFSTRDIM